MKNASTNLGETASRHLELQELFVLFLDLFVELFVLDSKLVVVDLTQSGLLLR
jgi:hypothetical protein